jgi:aspartate/methionine/tyrosine aminotransferase
VKHNSANLGQGFPSYGAPPFLAECVKPIMDGDLYAETGKPGNLNQQYTRPQGDPLLCQQIAAHYSPLFGREINAMTDIAVTVGAQSAIFTTLYAFANPGDEVLIVTPSFDASFKSAAVMGVDLKSVNMRRTSADNCSSSWTLDPADLRAALTPKTRVLMLNTPNSPTGKVLCRAELSAIARVVRDFPDLLVFSDEVYDKMVFPGQGNEHVHFASLPGMWERTFSVFSAGKTFSCTGWRIGFVVAPPALTGPLADAHTAMNFAAATPLQKACAGAFEAAAGPMSGEAGAPTYFEWLPAMLQARESLPLPPSTR